jgi:hypothetical protein
MDHLLDYFFLASVIIGYAFILPERSRYQLLFMLALFGAYDMSTFLAFGVSRELKISYLKFGPTEFRLALIIINGLVAQYGVRHMIGGLKFVNVGAFVGLCLMIYQTQKKTRKIDLAQKQVRVLTKSAKSEKGQSCGNVTVQPQTTLYELGSPGGM